MLTPDQVRPFLLHDDELVRERALVYFSEAADVSLLQADDLWTIVDRFGSRRAIYRALPRANHTPTSTQRLIQDFIKHRDSLDREVLEESILALPPELLETVTAHPVAGLLLSKTLSRGIERRRQLATTSTDALWDELIAFAERLDSDSKRQLDYGEGSIIVDELARRPGAIGLRAMQLIASPKTAESWLEVYLIDLVGMLKIQDATPYLLDVVGKDGDLVNEHAANALGKVGSAALAAEIADHYANASDAFQTYTPGGLSSMRSPEAEAALVRILEISSEDLDRNTFVADDLCDMCTTAALPALVDQIQCGQYQPGITNLDEHVLALAVMQGIDVPWAEECHRQRAEREERIASRLARLTGTASGNESYSYGQRAPKVAENRAWVPTSKKRKKSRDKKRR